MFLIEIILVMVILSSGLLYVLRAFSISISATKASEDYCQALALADERLWDLDFTGKKGVGAAQGQFSENGGYAWKEEVSSLKDAYGLNVVDMAILWGKSGKLDVITYIKNVPR